MTYTLKNGKQLNIRPISVDDAQQCIKLMQQVDLESEFLSRNVGEFTLTLQEEREFLQKVIDNARKICLVAVVDGQIVGNCSVDPIGVRQRFLHRAVFGITILKDFWGMGIGSLLMRDALQIAKKLGYEQIELEVVATNKRAIRLYKKFGFKTIGTLPHALRYVGGRYADEKIMVKFL